jgi:SAM-dependent methyltransferase
VPRAGDQQDYRSYVGPADQYDLIGASQFALLYALGLREHHRLLDIGCGSLRAGRMVISYLAPGGYTGVDPNRWLIDEAIEHELGRDILAVKRPTFDVTDDFSLGHLGRFDFVLAQGVATNTGPALLPRLLGAIANTVAPTGLAAATFIHPGTGDEHALEVSINDPTAAAWRYPGCYSYTRAAIADVVAAAGLQGREIGWYHPRHQWWAMSADPTGLPPEAFLATLIGPTLAQDHETSWQAPT